MKDEDFKRSAIHLTEVRKMLTSFLNKVEAQVEQQSNKPRN